MHKSCITKWKQKFETAGLDGIKLGYQGSSYLTLEQRDVVITWLQTKYNIELFTYLDERYDVTYQSRKLLRVLSAANISWKKSQKVNKVQPRVSQKSEKKSLIS